MASAEKKVHTKFRITGDWQKQALALQTRFSQLRHYDLQCEPGKEEDLLRRLGDRLGINREEVIKLIQNEQHENI